MYCNSQNHPGYRSTAKVKEKKKTITV
uniref:Uncharacterized protein n=1 Tax=Nelumbo nucifera TaxID=4432 RepID=A0A822Z7P2_NELNU|nr:TPA_asm: hypothetical protein HUJ06_014024 [Nelumbo nucifera]